MALAACRNPRSDYNWTVRDPGQVENEYRGLEEKLESLTRGLNKRVSTAGWNAWTTLRCSYQQDVWATLHTDSEGSPCTSICKSEVILKELGCHCMSRSCTAA